jgi:hypothetical protein
MTGCTNGYSCRVFEQSLGILLKFALNHVEALQIMDMPEFITHAKEVLTEALASDRVSNINRRLLGIKTNVNVLPAWLMG